MCNTILLIDDEPTWLSSHNDIINNAFPEMFEIKLASSAKQAIEMINESPPMLIITDLEMEKIDKKMSAGEFLIKKVKETHPDIKIIIISGASYIEIIAKRNNVDGFIPKWLLSSYPINLKLQLSEIFGVSSEIC